MPPSYGDSSSSLQTFLAAYFAIVAVIVIASIIFNIVVYWRICSKAGYSGAMSLLMFVPFGFLIMLCILAFGNWPALGELNQLRAMRGSAPFNPYQQGQPPFQQPMQGQFPPQQGQPSYTPPGNPYMQQQPGQSYPNNQ